MGPACWDHHRAAFREASPLASKKKKDVQQPRSPEISTRCPLCKPQPPCGREQRLTYLHQRSNSSFQKKKKKHPEKQSYRPEHLFANVLLISRHHAQNQELCAKLAESARTRSPAVCPARRRRQGARLPVSSLEQSKAGPPEDHRPPGHRSLRCGREADTMGQSRTPQGSLGLETVQGWVPRDYQEGGLVRDL